MNYLLQRPTEWLLFGNGNVASVKPFAPIQSPTIFVMHMDSSASGVCTLQGNSQHAQALIARRLRSEGEAQDEVKVIVHQITENPGGYQALYTVLPLQEWNRIAKWADEQAHHCMVVPLIRLLKSQLTRSGQAIIFKGYKEFIFLAKVDSRFSFASLQTFSQDTADLTSCIESLADLVRDEITQVTSVEGSNVDLKFKWISSFSERGEDLKHPDQWLIELFNKITGFSVELVDDNDSKTINVSGLTSSLGALISNFKINMAINPLQDKVWLVATQKLKFISFGSLAIAIALIFQTFGWFLQLTDIKNQTTIEENKISLIQSELATLQEKRKMPDDYSKAQEFLTNASIVQNSFDVYGLISTLKDASAHGARVMRVYGEASQINTNGKTSLEEPLLYVVAASAYDGNQQSMTRFVEILRNADYEVVPIDTAQNASNTLAAGSLLTYQLKKKNKDKRS